MATKEDNKWHMYFVYAVVLAIFGMVIYLVVVGQQTEDQYYATITFVTDESTNSVLVPAYPSGDDGTVYGGIKVVRDAFAAKMQSLGTDINVPATGAWSFNAQPRQPATGDTPDYYWSYTFPAPSELNVKESVIKEIVENDMSVGDFFSEAPADVLEWATARFNGANGPLSVSISYGNRAAAAASISV